jgi:dihydropteroate synthase
MADARWAVPADVSAEKSPALPRGFLRKGEAPASRLYLRPLGSVAGAGSDVSRLEVLVRGADGVTTAVASPEETLRWARAEGGDVGAYASGLLERLANPPAAFAGLALGRPLIMGIINVTPDSFSDGGEALDAGRALARGRTLADAGADILDVGGESTRPGAEPVSVDDELARVLPVVRGLSEAGFVVSVDTRRARVMEAALDAGAAIINDITALTGDPGSLGVAAARGAPVILVHMQGDPRTMQDEPRYEDAALDVYDYLAGRVAACEAAGVERTRLAVDPGIGFGKTVDHNVRILNRLALYHGLGCALVLGVSRKSFIARLSRGEAPKQRLAGSLAAALAAVAQGAHILRVHDVAETRQALGVWSAIDAAGTGEAPGRGAEVP